MRINIESGILNVDGQQAVEVYHLIRQEKWNIGVWQERNSTHVSTRARSRGEVLCKALHMPAYEGVVRQISLKRMELINGGWVS